MVPLPRKNGEVRAPVVLSTPAGSHAMGIFTPEKSPSGQPPVGYGRFQFEHARVVKWNCVFRLRQPEPLKPGDYSYQLYVVLGTREDCRRTLAELTKEFSGR